jgi:hypothetical protein
MPYVKNKIRKKKAKRKNLNCGAIFFKMTFNRKRKEAVINIAKNALQTLSNSISAKLWFNNDKNGYKGMRKKKRGYFEKMLIY